MLLAVSLVMGLLIAWLIVTVFFFVAWIWQTVVGLHEEEQLFIDEGEAHLAKEQVEIFRKMDRLRPYVTGSLVASVVLGVATFGVWVVQQLSQ